jgi:hypothetical protein
MWIIFGRIAGCTYSHRFRKSQDAIPICLDPEGILEYGLATFAT